MFGDKDRLARQVALRFITNTKMIEEIPLRDHIINMIELFNETKTLRAEINWET